MATLDDPKTAAVFVAATGISTDEAQAALGTLRARVEAVKDDPARVTAEVREFLAQYTERAKQQVLAAAAKAQRAATIGSWITFGVMVVDPRGFDSWRHGGRPQPAQRSERRRSYVEADIEQPLTGRNLIKSTDRFPQ